MSVHHATTSAFASGWIFADNGFGHMGGWGWGMAGLGLLFMLAIIGLVVSLIVFLVRSASRSGRSPTTGDQLPSAVEILDLRYARGEIDREEYLRAREDLGR